MLTLSCDNRTLLRKAGKGRRKRTWYNTPLPWLIYIGFDDTNELVYNT